MRKPMETLQDLIEEAKVRTVGWAICIFGIAYFLSHTSKSMWMNIPISILILSAFRYLSYEVEFRWRIRPIRRQTYLSHLQKKQLPVNDPRLSTLPSVPRWKRKIDSPPVEAAINNFINKILQDFMVDLWYSTITPDKEAPELIRVLILDVLGEISGRIKEINLVDLLTRDMVDLIGNHLDLYRRNQSQIGVDVMGTLSSEERDDRLKHHLLASKELHPALVSPECEYKVLQRLVGGVLAIVFRPREAQCPLVRCFSRELLTSLVLQPVMNFASPGYINELIEYLFINAKDEKSRGVDIKKSTSSTSPFNDHSVASGTAQNNESDLKKNAAFDESRNLFLATTGGEQSLIISEGSWPKTSQGDSEHAIHPRPADWARVLEAATKRRTQVLAPENLENMWAKGRNYKKKSANLATAAASSRSVNTPSRIMDSDIITGSSGKVVSKSLHRNAAGREDASVAQLMHELSSSTQKSGAVDNETSVSQDLSREPSIDEGHFADRLKEDPSQPARSEKFKLKRSSSTSALKYQPDTDTTVGKSSEIIGSQEFYGANFGKHREDPSATLATDLLSRSEGSLSMPKLKCRVVGAYFEKIGSKSFAVYSIAVTDVENKTWFVKRRYRNFERLHRHLKDIRNYALQLPPKRFLSSSIDDYFVHQRCILLDKYLQDLLSMANVAEQHEVWDFLSVSSKNYSFGKSTSVMKTLAVNVDDAMDDIVRQFKGVSDGLRRKVVRSPALPHAVSPPKMEQIMALPWNEEELNKPCPSNSNMETSHSLSDDEIHDEEGSSTGIINGWHSDNELNSKDFPPRVVKWSQESRSSSSQRSRQSGKFDRVGLNEYLSANSLAPSDLVEDQFGVPPEWTPPNVSVPLLNLVDKMFQLNRRGWLRRQVFWISKQILQLMMEDAIDDWLLGQIHWLRRDDVITQGIRWVQDVLWPNGTFFMKLESSQGKIDDSQFSEKLVPSVSRMAGLHKPSSFELQLEAARRASDVKKIILGGAPTTLVSLIGHSQYRRCAKDIYYFLQSTICLKQLAYGMLELFLVTVFPELQDLVLEIHGKTHA